MTTSKQSQSTTDTGRSGENMARQFLEKQGLEHIESNFNCKGGEIDLIMQDGDYRVFVEVRLRQAHDKVSAIESIGPQKQANVKKTALFYLQQSQLLDKIDCRIDVIAITQTSDDFTIDWIKNAF